MKWYTKAKKGVKILFLSLLFMHFENPAPAAPFDSSPQLSMTARQRGSFGQIESIHQKQLSLERAIQTQIKLGTSKIQVRTTGGNPLIYLVEVSDPLIEPQAYTLVRNRKLHSVLSLKSKATPEKKSSGALEFIFFLEEGVRNLSLPQHFQRWKRWDIYRDWLQKKRKRKNSLKHVSV